MNRGHGCHIPRAQYVWYPILQGLMALVVRPQASVAEKWSSTNRIRSQFARIKAAARHRYQLWLLRKTHVYGAKNPAVRSRRQCITRGESQDISQSESRDISQTKVRTR